MNPQEKTNKKQENKTLILKVNRRLIKWFTQEFISFIQAFNMFIFNTIFSSGSRVFAIT